MTDDLPIGQATKILLTVAALVIIIAGLRAGSPVLLPTVLAFFLSLLSFPLVDWLSRRGVSLPFALLLTVVAVVGLLVALGFMISERVNEFAGAAPGYVEQLVEKAESALKALETRNIRLSDWLTLDTVDPADAVDVLGGILGGTVKGLTSAVSYLTLVLVMMICMLAETAGMPTKLRRAFGSTDISARYLTTIMGEIQRYLRIKTVVSAVTGIFLGAWVALLGVPFPFLWGLVAFGFNYVPVIGSILAAVPPVLVTLVQLGPGRALLVAIGYLAVNLLVGNVLEPILMGRRFGLSTLVVFLSLVFWGWLWGPLGMLLSVPLTMVLKISLEHSSDLRWLAVLLEPGWRAQDLSPVRSRR